MNAPTVNWERRRNNNGTDTHYLTVNGQPAKLTLGTLPTLRLNHKAPTGKRGPVLVHGYDDLVYNQSEREWDEERGTHFYPYANQDHVDIFNAVIDATIPHLD